MADAKPFAVWFEMVEAVPHRSASCITIGARSSRDTTWP